MLKTTFTKLFDSTNRISYRRLLAFVAASGFLFVDKLNADQWVMVACVFIGGEALPKMVQAIKGA
jgi:hypothetical protein